MVDYKQLTRTLAGWIVSLIILIMMFAIVLDDINEQLEVNKMLIDKINSHTHEEEFISIHEKIYIVEHQHDEELVGIKQYEDKIRNLEWQLSTMEDRIVEIQRRLSP